jgi:hypothetical protein
MVTGTPLRDIAPRYGTAKSVLAGHRVHVKDALGRSAEAREMIRTGSLLDSVRTGEQRAESLFEQAREILAAALSNDDLRTVLQAIRTASAVMSEARGYMELRGELTNELGRDRVQGTIQIQITSGGRPGDMPRISCAHQDAIEPVEDWIEEIGLMQLS